MRLVGVLLVVVPVTGIGEDSISQYCHRVWGRNLPITMLVSFVIRGSK